ncbi:MAG TPA: hypothetical protein DCY89_00740 [Gammaproteobacteria bacterium]|nr:hypothetical protein [Gammaproteobacteria bacterium]
MKVTLDLDALLAEGHITAEEHARLLQHARQSAGNLALGILTGLGALAVVTAILALLPVPGLVVPLGIACLWFGGEMRRSADERRHVLAPVVLPVGVLLVGNGVLDQSQSNEAFFILAIVYAAAGFVARSAPLVVLAVLALAAAAAIGEDTSLFSLLPRLGIDAPLLVVTLFSGLAVICDHVSKRLEPEPERLTLAAARTAVVVAHFGFLIGSLWGDHGRTLGIAVTAAEFAVLWAFALLVTGIWAWRRDRRWVLISVALFASIHASTQILAHFGPSPEILLLIGPLGLLTLVAALWLHTLPASRVAGGKAADPIRVGAGAARAARPPRRPG